MRCDFCLWKNTALHFFNYCYYNRLFYFSWIWSSIFSERLSLLGIFLASYKIFCTYPIVMLYAIWYHLYNLKNGEKHPWRSVNSCNFTKINTPPWVFFTFLKLHKWYQIAQRITIMSYSLWFLFCYDSLETSLFKLSVKFLLIFCNNILYSA